MLLRKNSFFVSLILLLAALSCESFAVDNRSALARQNYILNCQGCHLADGAGSKDKVPRLTDFVAYFLYVEGGREFILQVPGAANAPINDGELADVMNWLLRNFSGEQLPENFVPYSSDEVGKLRKEPMIDIISRRATLIKRIQDKIGISVDGLSG